MWAVAVIQSKVQSCKATRVSFSFKPPSVRLIILVGPMICIPKAFSKHSLNVLLHLLDCCVENIYKTKSAFLISAPCKTPPDHVTNGLRVFEGLRHGDRAKYICRNGYKLIGITDNSPYLVCKYGSWSGGVPKCKECKSNVIILLSLRPYTYFIIRPLRIVK